jgi:hypothetical protein
MNLIKFSYQCDFGHDWSMQFINVNKWSLLQISLSFNDYPGFPYLQITSGGNGLLSILFWVYRFGMDVDVLSRTWKKDYREEEE